jgi:D-alanyl-D-alanine carboxypeptidase
MSASRRPRWAYRLTMMPKPRARRARTLRSAGVVVATGALVILGALSLGPLASSSSSTQTPTTSASAATLAASPAAGVTTPAPSGTLPPTSGPTTSPTPDPAVVAARLQRELDAVRAKLSIPGVSVAILWDDGRTWVGASGLRNVATADPMTTGTAFALASISKTFTAAVVLQLVEEGKLQLDQSVAPLLPKFKLDRRITVRMLLDHTSGLPDFFYGKGIDTALQRSPNATWTALRAWSYVPTPHAVPGKAWYYSNTNYLLLGELVTAVTGRPLATEVRTRLLDPLHLSTAYYQAVEKPKEAGTLAYELLAKTGGGWTVKRVAPASDVMPFRSVVTAAGGAGSIAATALDTARWMRAWGGGEVLDADMQAMMLADVARTVKLHATIPYGLGIQRVTLNGYSALGHSGRYLGIRNVVRYLPDAGITIAVLTNQSVYDPTRVASALLKVVLPTPSPSSSPGASSSPPPSGSPGAALSPTPGTP